MKAKGRILELCQMFSLSDQELQNLATLAKEKVGLFDHDGAICDTNQVKDELLGQFCRQEFGDTDMRGNAIEDDTVNMLHRQAHGVPMNRIFVTIAKEVYGLDISTDEGQEITERLNDFIRPDYINRKIYSKAAEYHELLYLLGMPQYILTGMEPDMVQASLENHEIAPFFRGILGAPITKAEHVNNILKKYPNRTMFASGDAASEYKATKHPGTMFIGMDMEGTGRRDIFPEGIAVVCDYDELIKLVARR